MDIYPRIETVRTLPNYCLIVTFQNGIVKLYECLPLLEEPAFAALRDKELFDQVAVDSDGYGVVWNDDIDLSESELWLNGVEIASLIEAIND